MEFDVVYHGRKVTHKDIIFIKTLIANNPDGSSCKNEHSLERMLESSVAHEWKERWPWA
ncbi:hypothetical protein HKBW3S03_01593 [Candidatus Hakubella thermalkaliphila]|uniref:Uncharacterized protein n=1 Tax=Candidatus Hakubella thermalkaliphila TaxID=2754717 RepID=A0A6V8NLA5_9ACTN|nr:hypothetical protein HKBW3S03_01593 [Candidatus Hakubella thermalkaliphila]